MQTSIRSEEQLGSAASSDAPAEAADSAALDASPDAVAKALGLLVKHLMISTNRDFFGAIEEAGITFTQIKTLQLLAEAVEPVAVGSLSETLGLSVAAVSRAADGLVQRGDVKRAEDPRDRRSKLLTMTSRGRRTWERFVALRFAGIKRYVEGLTDEEREGLIAGIGPLVERVKS
jgi:DNA-binding MarR family transcriptional regulator